MTCTQRMTPSQTRNCEVCAQPFRVRPSDDRKADQRGHRRRRFCSTACQHSTYIGEGNPKWRGGTHAVGDGYVRQHAPDHPHAVDGYVLQHRLVMEQKLGRLLTPDEVVHHVNHIRDDNRPENLALMADLAEHQTHHGEWQIAPCAGCETPVRSSAAQRRRGHGKYCSRRCGALAGSRAATNARKANR